MWMALLCQVISMSSKDSVPYLPVLLPTDGMRAALLRKLILSMDTWKSVAYPLESVSMSSKNPSRQT